MKTAILVHGPDFACSENLTKAFALWGETTLISIYPSDWRDYDPGLLVHDDETLAEAREVVDEADLLFLGDATSLWTLARISQETDWFRWARGKPLMAFFGDSAYYKHPLYFDGLCWQLNIKRPFLLPNLIPFCAFDAIPLHHPMPLYESEKAETLTVMHAPGRDGKAAQKGTAQIETVIKGLQENGAEFDYRRLMYLTLEECLAVKATAHIVIDQLPPPGLPSGLGRTGLEALAAGSVVLTSMYDADLVAGYFDYPPVIPIREQADLESSLQRLLTDDEQRQIIQEQSQAWVRENVELGPWLAYVGRWL